MRNFLKRLSSKEIDFSSLSTKENDFFRLSVINLIVALFITPIFAILIYNSSIPKVYFYLSLSYTLLFPIYILICWTIPFLRNHLFSFFVFHLFGMSLVAFIDLVEHNFDVVSLFSFFSLFSLSLFVIQRYVIGIIYIVYVLFSLFYAFQFIEDTPIISKKIIFSFFFVISISGIFVYHLRHKLLTSLHNLNTFLNEVSKGNTFGFFIFTFENQLVNVKYFDNEVASTLTQSENNTSKDLDAIFNSVLTASDFSSILSLADTDYLVKQIKYEDHYFDLRFSPLFLNKKKYFLIKSNDITDRVKEQYKLINSENKYRNLYNENQAGVFTLDKFFIILDFNKKFEFIFENTFSFGDVFLIDDQLNEYIDIIFEQHQLNNIQIHYTLKNGNLKWFIFNFYYDVQNELIEGNVVDISDLQIATESLRKSEQKFKMLYEESNDAIIVIENNKVIDVNLKCTQLFGLTKSQFLDTNLWDLTYNKTDEVLKQGQILRKKLSDTGSIKFDWVFIGKFHPIEAKVMTKEIHLGRQSFYQVIIHDVTDMNRTIRALKSTSENFHSVLESTPEGILIIQNNEILYANKHIQLLYGTRQPEFSKLFIAEHQTIFQQLLKEKLESNANLSHEFTILSEQGNKQVDIILVTTSYESTDAILVIMKDISFEIQLSKETIRAELAEENSKKLQKEIEERIRTERELENLLLKTKLIYDSSGSIFLLTFDLQGRITYFNKQAYDFFKNIVHRPLEIGLTMQDYFATFFGNQLLPVEDATKMFSEMLSGKTIDQEFKFFINNQHFWIHSYINPIFDVERNLSEIVIMSHDITSKKESELEIIESLREKEVLLKEIHHRVKNNLQVISSILNLQTSYVKDKETLNILLESRNRIRSMAIIHENLYSTSDLSSIDFASYLKNLGANLMALYFNKDFSIQIQYDLDRVDLTIDQAVPCGLIMNELITNCFKYAFKDSTTNNIIFISLKLNNNQVEIKVKDNGVGLPPDFVIEDCDTLGLQLVVTLIEQLDATLSYKVEDGTEFLINFELL